MIKSDLSLVVGWVNRKSNRPWKLINELNRKDLLMGEVDCIGVSHIFKEANTIADGFTKEGCGRISPLWELYGGIFG